MITIFHKTIRSNQMEKSFAPSFTRVSNTTLKSRFNIINNFFLRIRIQIYFHEQNTQTEKTGYNS